MEYSKEEKKAIEDLKNKRDEAYGLMQFEDGELYQLAEKEFNNYCTIEKLIEKQQKEIEYKDKKIEKLLNIKLYACDANKNKDCNKRHCYIDGGECDATTNKEKVKYVNLDDYVPIDKYRKIEKEVERYRNSDYKTICIEDTYLKNLVEKLEYESIPKEAIREKMNREKMLTIFYGRQNGRSIEQGIRIAKIKAYEELLGE